MKHLFVPYELCVLAKEKGFNEPCMGYWATQDDLSMPYYIEKQREHVILAPLYQQLIDWLYYPHNIVVGYHYELDNWTVSINRELKFQCGDLDSALEEAFKLI